MSKLRKILPLALFLPILFAQGNAPANRGRGKKTGGFDVALVGDVVGKGTATIANNTISITATFQASDGSGGALVLPALPIVNDHFRGNGTLGGASCLIEGRVDLPSANDPQTTDAQALTARIAATLSSNGKMAVLIGIQQPASRGGGNANNGNANPNSGNGNGNGSSGN